MNGFIVFLNGEYFDEVFFSCSINTDDVRASLIEHDGYPADIVVKSFRTSVAI